MTALSVNLNKVALLRNTRTIGIPSVEHAAVLALEAGADGITVHPRPDGRHVRAPDVAQLVGTAREVARVASSTSKATRSTDCSTSSHQVHPHQCTFVPDESGAFTSDHGWNLPADAERLAPLVRQARSLGVRVSLFMDPVPDAMAHAAALGARPHRALHGAVRAGIRNGGAGGGAASLCRGGRRRAARRARRECRARPQSGQPRAVPARGARR